MAAPQTSEMRRTVGRLAWLAWSVGLFGLTLATVLVWPDLVPAEDRPPLRVGAAAALLALMAVVWVSLRRMSQQLNQADLAVAQERALVDALPIGVVVWDAQGRLVLANADFRQRYAPLAELLQPGTPVEAVLRQAVALGLVPEAAGREEAWLQHRLEEHRRGGTRTERLTADGRWRRIVESRLPDGRLLGHSVDVTELIHKEQALENAHRAAEQARRQLRDAIEALPATFELYDADDRLVLYNKALAESYPRMAPYLDQQMSFEALARLNVASGGQPEAAADVDGWVVLRQRERQHPQPGASRLLPTADGRWLRMYETRLSDGGIVAIRVDVTELEAQRLQARDAQRVAETAEARLHDAIDALPDGFALYDADDRLVTCNSRYRELYAASAEAMVPGARFEDILRLGLRRGQYATAVGREQDWLAERLWAHRHPGTPLLQQLPDNRWLRIDERPTREGGVAGVRTEVTEMVRKEQALTGVNERISRLNDELARLSETDALTGLANRRQFDRRLADEWARAQRHDLPLSLVIVDIDHFKRYNDLHGHPAGDRCLQQVAAVLREAARRPSDLVARLGGEEFAVLLPHDNADAAAAWACNSLCALEEAALPHGDSPVARHVTASMGVADRQATDAPADPSALLKAADAALYAAKQQGRHRVALAPSAPPPGPDEDLLAGTAWTGVATGLARTRAAGPANPTGHPRP